VISHDVVDALDEDHVHLMTYRQHLKGVTALNLMAPHKAAKGGHLQVKHVETFGIWLVRG
jgi:hypothetical protein